MFNEIQKEIVLQDYECPTCGEKSTKGMTIYHDNYRGEHLCDYCIDDYKKEVIQEEGLDGRLLK